LADAVDAKTGERDISYIKEGLLKAEQYCHMVGMLDLLQSAFLMVW